jgi:hypothetical protein
LAPLVGQGVHQPLQHQVEQLPLMRSRDSAEHKVDQDFAAAGNLTGAEGFRFAVVGDNLEQLVAIIEIHASVLVL